MPHLRGILNQTFEGIRVLMGVLSTLSRRDPIESHSGGLDGGMSRIELDVGSVRSIIHPRSVHPLDKLCMRRATETHLEVMLSRTRITCDAVNSWLSYEGGLGVSPRPS